MSHLSPWPSEMQLASAVHCSAVVSGICVTQKPMMLSSETSLAVPLSCRRIGRQLMPAAQSDGDRSDCRHTALQRAVAALLPCTRKRRSQQFPLAQNMPTAGAQGDPSNKLADTSVQCS